MWLWLERPFAERIEQAVALGFDAIEFAGSSRADIPAVLAAQERYGLKIAVINLDLPRMDETLRGYLADPRWRADLDRQLDRDLPLAQKLGARLHVPVGNRVPELTSEQQRETIIENLKRIAPLAASAGVTLLIEALNPFDNPGFYLTTSQQGFDIVRAVNHPYVKFQFDLYHIQIMEGNLIQRLTQNLDWIGHVQIADVPGRHQPGTGEINFPNVFRALKDANYQGCIGLEYAPDASRGDVWAWRTTI